MDSEWNIRLDEATCKGIRIALCNDEDETAHAYLYVFRNDVHFEPVGYLEDVLVREDLRGQGLGKALILRVIDEASSRGCYKLVATSRYSRPNVHRLYERSGFRNHGIEFRLDLK